MQNLTGDYTLTQTETRSATKILTVKFVTAQVLEFSNSGHDWFHRNAGLIVIDKGSQTERFWPWAMIRSTVTEWKYRTSDEETHNGGVDPS